MDTHTSTALAYGTLQSLIMRIEQTHHAFTRTQLERIADMFEELSKENGPQLTKIRNCFNELRMDLIPHLVKEERILFPYIAALESNPQNPPAACFGSISNPINMMQIEHVAVRKLLEELRVLSDEYSTTLINDMHISELYTALAALDADLIQHIHFEDDVLFPRAQKLEASLGA